MNKKHYIKTHSLPVGFCVPRLVTYTNDNNYFCNNILQMFEHINDDGKKKIVLHCHFKKLKVIYFESVSVTTGIAF